MTLHAFHDEELTTRCQCGEITVAEALKGKEHWTGRRLVKRDECEAPFDVRQARFEAMMAGMERDIEREARASWWQRPRLILYHTFKRR